MTPKDAQNLKRLDESIAARIKKIERLKTLEEVYTKIEAMIYTAHDTVHDWDVVDFADIHDLFEELRDTGKQ